MPNNNPATSPASSRRLPYAAPWGAAIGTLAGLIGLGGAEFRLPVLLGVFRFQPLEAVILNKAMSLVAVATALPFRARSVPFTELIAHWPIIVNLLCGSLLGAWLGASWATRLRTDLFYRVIATLLLLIAVVLFIGHDHPGQSLGLSGPTQYVIGILAGFLIGVIAALMGVAGGEFLIPTLVLLFGLDLQLAGSLSLAISLPTMLTGFARYSRDSSFVVLTRNRRFVLLMAAGSIAGTFLGGQLLKITPTAFLLPMLAAILVFSAVKIWRHA